MRSGWNRATVGRVTPHSRSPLRVRALPDLCSAKPAREIGSVTPGLLTANGAGPVASKTAADFGADLFEALFRDEAREVLVRTESAAEGSGDGVRIRLTMDLRGPGMAEVASLPWELMCRRGQRPLAVSTQTLLVRSLDVPGSTKLKPFRAPLRILALMSNPKGTSPLNLKEERKRIEENWARLPGVKVDFVRPVRQDLFTKLAAEDYHVIHYMGHGDFDAVEGGMLLLEKEDGSPDPITSDDFAMMLADEPLRLLFLNACKTGTTSVRDGLHPFAGVAAALIRERVPAVVAMQFPISDQAAIAFAQTFYERISQGLPVDAAVAEGRKVLYSGKQPEWATPVLYLRSKDGVLFGSVDCDEAEEDDTKTDPWGPGSGDVLRVFLATPDQNMENKHAQLARALKALDWVRVVDSVSRESARWHAAAVDNLVRRADLCVHLLGANAGQRVDDNDPPDTLRTWQLEELRIGLEAARSQLVLMTGEDRESVANGKYAARIAELAEIPRDKARFELAITDKNRIADTVLVRLQKLKDAREAERTPPVLPGVEGRSALVDSHVCDQERAIDLVAYLEDHSVDTRLWTGVASSDAGFALRPLYIIVAGKVDPVWVRTRRIAAQKSAVKSRAALLIAKYAALPAEGSEEVEITRARLEILTQMNDSDPAWLDALFAAGNRA